MPFKTLKLKFKNSFKKKMGNKTKFLTPYNSCDNATHIYDRKGKLNLEVECNILKG